ncbi:MAG: glycosyltransferase [Ruminococcus flavefaciens]|nr:glycosyltransferase [Ruminococcus flavefaciens]
MSMVNISVIMPLYNAEKYLKEALQSILRQTYDNFDVICINDASTDATMEILRQFRAADDRIRILENPEHLGAAISRNRGIGEAKGKYITFLDGDDIFDEEMLELAYKKAENYDVDIVMYEYMHVPSSCIYDKKFVTRNNKFVGKYCNAPFSVLGNEPIEFMNWTAAACNKLYKRSFILANHLEFQTLSSSNDVYFVEMALLLAGKVIMLDDRRVMVYARDHETPTRISNDRDPMCAYWAREKIGKELLKRNVFGEAVQHYFYRTAYHLMGIISEEKDRERAEIFYNFLQNEGIEKLLGLGADYRQKLDDYVYKLLKSFKEKNFDSEWYKERPRFEYHLYKNSREVLSLFHSYEAEAARVCIWGMDINGRSLLDFLQLHEIKIAGVVDSDKGKQGQCIDSYIVKASEEVLGNIQVVIACSPAIYKEAIAALKGKNIEVINIKHIIEKE